MLLYAQARWPQIITPEFWPFSVRHAINIYNNCYYGNSSNNCTAIAEFTSTDPKLQLTDLHPWGCPVYVLEKHLQDGAHHLQNGNRNLGSAFTLVIPPSIAAMSSLFAIH